MRNLSSLAASLCVIAIAACGSVQPDPPGGDDDGTDVDAAGDPTIDAPDTTGDTDPPDTTLTITPPLAANDPVAHFEFASSEAASTFRCKLDAATAVSCTTPYTTAALANGDHTFEVAAIDAAGNIDPTAAIFAWTVDTGAPSIAIDSGPGAATNDTTPTFTFTVTGASVVTCAIDGVNFAACTSTFTASTLAAGPHNFTIRAADVAGNTAMAVVNFAVDTVLPVVTIGGHPANPTKLTTGTVTWTSSETASFSCRLDGGTATACGSGTSGTRSLSGLSAGTHTLAVTATDPAGNPGTQSTTWTVDLTAPTLRFVGTPPSTYTTTITFNLSSTEATDFTCVVFDELGNRVDGPRACGSGTTGTITYGTGLPSGQFLELDVGGTDTAGNAGTTIIRLFCRGTATACTAA